MLEADLDEQLARAFTTQDAVELMRADFDKDPRVVGLDIPESYLGTLFTEEDMKTVSVLVGSQEYDEPAYGLRHDYRQAKVAVKFYQDFVRESAAAYDDDQALLDLIMDVPDFPPYQAELVDERNEPRKFEAPQTREDYRSIMMTLGLAAPPSEFAHLCDQVLTGWTLTPKRVKDEPMFVGRSELEEEGIGIGEVLGSYVRLRFNPITPLGAAMVQRADYSQDHMEIKGHYEVRGKLYPFRYKLHESRYIVAPDEWVPKLGVRSFELMAFDLVSDFDFWPFHARPYEIGQGKAIRVQDRLMPAHFRYVDYDPERKSYHQKTSGEELSPFVMHAGSSLVHRVDSRPAVEVLGDYVALEQVAESEKGFWLFEQTYDLQATGIFTRLPRMTEEVVEPHRWKAGQRVFFKYREGDRNAVKVSLGDQREIYVFRSKQKPLASVAAFAKERGRVLVRDYPLLGIWTNPLSSKLVFDGLYFRIATSGRKAMVFNTFFLHRGVYTNRQGTIALEGLDIFSYMLAHREAGRLRAVYEMCGSPEWMDNDRLVDAIHNAVGQIESLSADQAMVAYYQALFAPDSGGGPEF